jgi:hypothetical protein
LENFTPLIVADSRGWRLGPSVTGVYRLPGRSPSSEETVSSLFDSHHIADVAQTSKAKAQVKRSARWPNREAPQEGLELTGAPLSAGPAMSAHQ